MLIVMLQRSYNYSIHLFKTIINCKSECTTTGSDNLVELVVGNWLAEFFTINFIVYRHFSI